MKSFFYLFLYMNLTTLVASISLMDYQHPSYYLQIYNRLKKEFGELKPPLNFNTVEQLAVAVILSAQCTDERVNIVTQALFKECPDMYTIQKTPIRKLEKLIYSTGFYKNKASNLKKLATILIQNHNGKIPEDFNTLITLPGIGRKTANVIMAVAFNKTPGIVVDTHVKRISQRLGFTQEKTPEKVEKALMKFLPKELWNYFPLSLIFFGRKYCRAISPLCHKCILSDICPSYETLKK